MRAWILEKQAKIEDRPLELVEVPTPHPQDDEVRIKILVCGVCRTDIHIAEGDLPLLYNLKKSDAEEFFGIVNRLELKVGMSLFPFEELQDALILAKKGKLEQPNAVILNE
jgi:threonine dehydrogenase-like Zn-dependent dehydrogenase